MFKKKKEKNVIVYDPTNMFTFETTAGRVVVVVQNTIIIFVIIITISCVCV